MYKDIIKIFKMEIIIRDGAHINADVRQNYPHQLRVDSIEIKQG